MTRLQGGISHQENQTNCLRIQHTNTSRGGWKVVEGQGGERGEPIDIKYNVNSKGVVSDIINSAVSQRLFIFLSRPAISYLNSKGLIIICNLVHEICIVKISGWSFGKVGGLLGVYDNEPSNEFMTLNRTISSNLGDFISSWKSPGDVRPPSSLSLPAFHSFKFF